MAANKTQVGTVGGAVFGALIGQEIGRNTESTLIGAAVGGAIGYLIGREMDEYDRQQLNNVYERGVSGQPFSWVNPNRGTYYQATPQPAFFQNSNNQPCRRVDVRSNQSENSITGCRNPVGNWVIQG